MSPDRRDRLILLALSLLVNGLVASLIASPGYTDAYYYFNAGRWLALGQPLRDPYLWNYINPPASIPVPAFGYWQPMPSLVAALGMIVFGPTFDGAQVAFVLLIALLPQFAYGLGRQVGTRRQALLAGLFTVFSGYYVIYWTVTESFTPFAVVGSAALLLAGKALVDRRWFWWVLAGGCAALGHLTRADGVLLLGVVGFAALFPSAATSDEENAGKSLAPIVNALIVVAGYVLAMLPWLIRNQIVSGSPLASGGTATLWMLEHNDLFLFPETLSPERYFAAGWGAILHGKWIALRGNAATFIGVQNIVVLTPLTIIGLWKRWRMPRFLPAVLYEVLLFFAMTFAFTFPGVGGGFFHSGTALMPFVAVAASLGLDDALMWAALRRQSWHFERARRLFAPALVFIVIMMTGFLVAGRVVGDISSGTVSWNHSEDVYDEVEAALQDNDFTPDAPVMSNDTPGFYYRTGRGGIPIPNGDEQDLLAAADAYAVTLLVIDNQLPEGLVSFYDDGPESARFHLLGEFDSPRGITYLYRIDP